MLGPHSNFSQLAGYYSVLATSIYISLADVSESFILGVALDFPITLQASAPPKRYTFVGIQFMKLFN